MNAVAVAANVRFYLRRGRQGEWKRILLRIPYGIGKALAILHGSLMGKEWGISLFITKNNAPMGASRQEGVFTAPWLAMWRIQTVANLLFGGGIAHTLRQNRRGH